MSEHTVGYIGQMAYESVGRLMVTLERKLPIELMVTLERKLPIECSLDSYAREH